MMFGCSYANVWKQPVSSEEIVKETPKLKSIKGTFSQEKILPNIKKTLISYGDFEFTENKGISFYTVSPVKSEVDYTNKKYKQINDIVNAIASKKYKKLEQKFDFYLDRNYNILIIGLKPKDKNKEFISSVTIEIKNSDYIKKIKIELSDGGTTTVWFVK